jgi:hypothetical protein
MKIIFGANYKDLITGFKGIAIGYVEYITGCNQVLIVPKSDNSNEKKDSHWIDEQRLERVGKKILEIDNGNNPGFDIQPNKK